MPPAVDLLDRAPGDIIELQARERQERADRRHDGDDMDWLSISDVQANYEDYVQQEFSREEDMPGGTYHGGHAPGRMERLLADHSEDSDEDPTFRPQTPSSTSPSEDEDKHGAAEDDGDEEDDDSPPAYVDVADPEVSLSNT